MTIAVILIYFAVLLGIGWYSSHHEHAEDFLIGDRKLGVGETTATILA